MADTPTARRAEHRVELETSVIALLPSTSLQDTGTASVVPKNLRAVRINLYADWTT